MMTPLEKKVIERLTGRTRRTPVGGYAIRVINGTGADSVKGSVVAGSTAEDNTVRLCPANAVVPFGVMLEDGIPDGELCWVVVTGIADVLLKDTASATRGYWVGMSDVDGRAYTAFHTGTTPPEQATHNLEIGHCSETKAAGTDVLVKCILHFN